MQNQFIYRPGNLISDQTLAGPDFFILIKRIYEKDVGKDQNFWYMFGNLADQKLNSGISEFTVSEDDQILV